MAKATRWTQKDIDEARSRMRQTQDHNAKATNDPYGYARRYIGGPLEKISDIEKADKKNRVHIPKEEPAALRSIKQQLTLLKIEYVTEHVFHPTRKFRFDIALVKRKIAIEYEGIISEKSRHTGIEGFTNDCRKYNLAQIHGWIVLRYTTLNSKEFYQELKKLITTIP